MVEKERIGVLIVDMQGFWFDKAWNERGAFFKNMKGFLEVMDRFGDNVSFWYAEYYAKGKTVAPVQIDGRYVEGRIVVKNGWDVFAYSSLAEQMRLEGVSDVIVGGVCARKCVLGSMRGARKGGLNVFFEPSLVKNVSGGSSDYLHTYKEEGFGMFDSLEEVFDYVRLPRNR